METTHINCPSTGNNQKEKGEKLLYQLGTGGHTQRTHPVQGAVVITCNYFLGRGSFNSNHHDI